MRDYYPRGRSFLKSVSDPQLATPIVLPWSQWIEQAIGRTPGPITLGETIVQVLTHSGHHRAQANARLRALGAEPPLIDYIGWLWLERPAPAWPFDSLTLAQGWASSQRRPGSGQRRSECAASRRPPKLAIGRTMGAVSSVGGPAEAGHYEVAHSFFSRSSSIRYAWKKSCSARWRNMMNTE